MHRSPTQAAREPRRYRGSAVLASSVYRVACIAPAIIFLWGLACWAMA